MHSCKLTLLSWNCFSANQDGLLAEPHQVMPGPNSGPCCVDVEAFILSPEPGAPLGSQGAGRVTSETRCPGTTPPAPLAALPSGAVAGHKAEEADAIGGAFTPAPCSRPPATESAGAHIPPRVEKRPPSDSARLRGVS